MRPKQSIPKHLRFTIQDFTAQFPDDDACLESLKEQKYPSGLIPCKKCGVDRKHHRVTGRPAYACDYCGSMVSPMAGTIFEKSSTSLLKWFYAMYLMSSTRCGISAKQIQREVGVTYKTAWRMFKQIRTLMSEDISLEGEAVEIDEMFWGGKRKDGVGRMPGYGGVKQPILGMVEREGRVVALTVPDVTAKTLCGAVREFVMPESTVFTDENSAYNTVSERRRYTHHRINHSTKVYVMGDIHTNTIEGFWSLVRRGIGGVYHSVSRKYLQSYLDEYSWRYNRRNSPVPMFISLLDEVAEPVKSLPLAVQGQ